MRKLDSRKQLRLQLKRGRKTIKRRRANRTYFNRLTAEAKEISFKKDADSKVLKSFKFELNDFLDEKGNIPSKKLDTEIVIPDDFSLESNYDETILTLSLIRKSLFRFLGNRFNIDFAKCKNADFSGLFLLKVILEECIRELKRLDKSLQYIKSIPEIRIHRSEKEEVNLRLLANGIIQRTQNKEVNFIPVSKLNLITGRRNQKHYAENKKGSATTTIREYINVSLKRHHFELNAVGTGYLDGLISEILNNAEDHSIFDRWYVYANLFETKRDSTNLEIVSEINLAFLNFGNSIFEGFEETKIQNHKVYNEMDSLYKIIYDTYRGKRFSKENLFTLYALQEGNSRLKYEKESRGTGTMKFINSFLSLGDYEDKDKNYLPHLLIYSGATMLKCDNKYKPFLIENSFYLSLNDSNDMTIPPESSHLRSLDSRFPGTLLIGKLYLNEDHLKNKIENDGS